MWSMGYDTYTNVLLNTALRSRQWKAHVEHTWDLKTKATGN